MKHKSNPKPKTPPPPSHKYHKTMYPFPSCFHRRTTTLINNPTTTTTTTTTLTTCLYQTHLGIFSLTWSHSFLARSLHLQLHPTTPLSTSPPSAHLSLKPFLFWTKHGFKKLTFPPSNPLYLFWDLTNAKFGPGPEPESGFYIAVLSQEEMTLLVGDLEKQAYHKTRAKKPKIDKKLSSLVLRREHLVGKNKYFATKTNLGGKNSLILIELNENWDDDPRLVIKFDEKNVLEVKHLRWKFRGSERIEVDGHQIQLSWDVHNWLFEQDEGIQDDGYALFTFRFEDQEHEAGNKGEIEEDDDNKRVVMWSEDSCGLNFERKKMKKRVLMKKTRSSPSFSSSSLSSVSSGCSSVMEWESVEENELKEPMGYSLLVYAWKS